MKLCKPEQVVFFGSGIELVDYYKIVKSRKIDAYIFLAPRHAKEIFYGKKLIDHFIENEILYFIENDINCPADLHSILKNKDPEAKEQTLTIRSLYLICQIE